MLQGINEENENNKECYLALLNRHWSLAFVSAGDT